MAGRKKQEAKKSKEIEQSSAKVRKLRIKVKRLPHVAKISPVPSTPNKLQKIQREELKTQGKITNIVRFNEEKLILPKRVLRNQKRKDEVLQLVESRKGSEPLIAKRESRKPPKLRDSRTNLAHKSNLIEEMLLCEQDVEELPNISNENNNNEQNAPGSASKFHKFFHRNAETDQQLKKRLESLKSQRILQFNKKRSETNSKPKNKLEEGIYEFLSQSGNSDSDTTKQKDPTKDIVQKLIAEGKVRVMTNQKGKGRPRPKRILKKKTIKKPEEKALEGGHAKDKEMRSVSNSPVHNNDENDRANWDQAHLESEQQSHSNENTVNGFSTLARSVLLHQTVKTYANKTDVYDRPQNTGVHRKIISTPLRRDTPTLQTTNLSPIMMSNIPSNSTKSASPWRLKSNSHLPSTFHLSFTSSNLPSFSSDNIPATPRKKHTRNSVHSLNCTKQADSITAPKEVSDDLESFMHTLSSYSSNDSNGENMPPLREQTDTHEDLLNIRQHTSPMRCLKGRNRSPLKDINILEVITLPKWKDGNSKESNESSEKNDNTVQEVVNESDFFGFDEYIEKEENEEPPPEVSSTAASYQSKSKKNIRKKLKELKKFHPVEKKNLVRSTTSKRICPVFDDDIRVHGQRNIKEMLCSTRIGESTKEKCIKESDADLFKDTELCFNKEATIRSYTRPARKKKKVGHFSTFLESDESDNEEPPPVVNKKKRREQAQEDNVELDSFVDEFNQMCNDVEQYQLIVE